MTSARPSERAPRTHPVPPGCPPDAIVIAFRVPREFAGTRLDRFVQNRLPRLSRTRAQAVVKSSAYRPDGSRMRSSDLVREGETVLLVRETFEEPDTPQTYGVVHEDDALYVVDKPAGLPVHPTATYHRNTLVFLLRTRFGEDAPRIAHRLDRETSGVLVCARTIEDERTLKNAFENRRVKKTYLAVLRGELAEESGDVRLPIAPVREGLHLLMEVRDDGDDEGSRAETSYAVLRRAPGHTLVALSPHTGRQHQLRVHMAAIGFPILGDKLYGPEREAPFLEALDTGLTPELLARLGHPRQALHAHRITFEHPRAAVPLTLEAPFAPDLADLWRRLGGDFTEAC